MDKILHLHDLIYLNYGIYGTIHYTGFMQNFVQQCDPLILKASKACLGLQLGPDTGDFNNPLVKEHIP